MDTLSMVSNKEKDFTSLWERMDEDRDKVQDYKFELRGVSGQWKNKPIPGVVNVSMNSAAVFLNVVISQLIETKWQTVVEGRLSGPQQLKIENFIDSSMTQADERLQKKGIPGLKNFVSSHICSRGWIGARWIWYEDNGVFVPDVLPLDMRYCVYERSPDGFNWVASKSYVSPSVVATELGIEQKGTKDVLLTDFWDGEKEEIWIEKTLVKTNIHKLKYPPFVIIPAPSGFMFLDKGYREYEGESILFMNRDLYDELSRIVSIEQTLNMKKIMPPYQIEVETKGEQPAPYPDVIGAVNEVPPNSLYKLLEQSDINRASQMVRVDMLQALQQGGVNNIDLGNINYPTSAVWITEQTEIRNKILSPRLKALEMFLSQLARMNIDTFIKGGVEADLGKKGSKKHYKPADLGNPDEYSIEYRLMGSNKKQEIANTAIASAIRGTLSEDTIRKDIMMCADPDGEKRKLDVERAEKIDPTIMMFRLACALVDEADQLEGVEADQKRLESMMLTERAVNMLQGGAVPESQYESPRSNPNMIMPLMAGMGATQARGEGRQKEEEFAQVD